MLIKALRTGCMLVTFGYLSACASTSSQAPQTVVLAKPLQVNYQSEVALARLGQMLNSGEYNQEQMAQLYYERGIVFDRVGLRALARFDFNRAIQLKPDFVEAYNFLGVYFTLAEEFDSAFEAFDSAVELAPDYSFAYFYRGIALNYANKPQLAMADVNHYADQAPNDPYRVLWRYLIQLEAGEPEAQNELVEALKTYRNEDWGWQIVRLYAGEIDQQTFLGTTMDVQGDNRALAERLCEAYFYMAKLAQRAGDPQLASSYFKLSLANNVYDFVEHRLALFELNRYESQI
ncbi:lipoprotein NlpI [Agarivorans sp. OAG1]|uniref:Lipoprotein NlpI n=1 Tax=Agarivorans albus MKT 106 TaxID=1331007 RepID=R9PTH0_AGAAL|nr:MULTISPECIES: lipoprotein NlpI [Agarivorans]MPW28898.1 lipoprotein NlpI [Agarivorans sp. B2Z047]UQN41456.1 lipoprotein NlpI [Agarivorans sp. B2Z047]BEU02594.1 lipoprotein NlpI [Agarivorans sp. OAG1]GAD02406.1 lipoprotein nlpI precursor [Agarivorans albus MKT 106]